MPEYINPLSFIGQSNAPLPNTTALRDLQTKGTLQELTDKAARERAESSQASLERRTGLPFGLDPTGRTPEYASRLEELRKHKIAGIGAETGERLQRSGFAIDEPTKPRTAADIGLAPFVGGALLPGAAAEKEKIVGTTGGELTEEWMGFNDAGDFVKFTKKQHQERKGTLQGGDAVRQEAKKLWDDAGAEFPGQEIEIKKSPTTGDLLLFVDGQLMERNI